MKAVVIDEPGSVAVETVADPAPGPREVVIEVGACGICGTDIHIIDGDISLTRYPIVPGHEFAGEVVATGSDVTELAVGDRVAVDPNLPCRECHFCNIGRSNLCERYSAIGVTRGGAAAQFATAPVGNCFRLPEGLNLGHAALIEPLSCAVHAFDLLPRRSGDHYLIYGAGTMGLLMLQMARAAGAASVGIVDLNGARMLTARKLGADAAATTADALDRPQGWETVIDCTGAVPAIEDGLGRVRRGGTFQVFGVTASGAVAKFSPFRVYNDEITIVGSMAVLHSFGRAVDLMGRGVIDADTMISDSFALDDYGRAIAAFRQGRGRKLQVLPGEGTSP